MRAEIGARHRAAAQRPGAGAWLGVFLFTLLMITREGMEFAFVAASHRAPGRRRALLAGALIGLVLAGLLACGLGALRPPREPRRCSSR